MHSGSFRKSEASDEPAGPEGRRVMMKQIVASNFNGVAHSSFWLGIILGLNDIFTSTITTGFDLEGDTAEKYMSTAKYLWDCDWYRHRNQTDNSGILY